MSADARVAAAANFERPPATGNRAWTQPEIMAGQQLHLSPPLFAIGALDGVDAIRHAQMAGIAQCGNVFFVQK